MTLKRSLGRSWVYPYTVFDWVASRRRLCLPVPEMQLQNTQLELEMLALEPNLYLVEISVYLTL